MVNQSGETPGFSGGRRFYDPELAARTTAARQNLTDSIYDFVDGLPVGETGEAARVIEYTQPDSMTCFYASLGGVAAAVNRSNVDICTVGARAQHQGLLNRYGAVTFSESQAAQREFVRQEMGLDIRFINTRVDPDQARIDAVTQGLIEGNHVIFGLPKHWIALDGISKFSRARDHATWTGMNPAGAKRLEDDARRYVTPQTVINRLIAGDLPVVVVEDASSKRFSGHRRVIARNTIRFGPARRS